MDIPLGQKDGGEHFSAVDLAIQDSETSALFIPLNFPASTKRVKVPTKMFIPNFLLLDLLTASLLSRE